MKRIAANCSIPTYISQLIVLIFEERISLKRYLKNLSGHNVQEYYQKQQRNKTLLTYLMTFIRQKHLQS